MKSFFLSFAALILIGTGAQAGILIDPYFGYVASGKSNPGDQSVSGTDMGARLGWTTFGFGVGLDATIAGTYTYKAGGVSGDYTPAHTGVFVSYKFPILVRGYATYFINSKISATGFSYTGNSTKLGVQYTGLPFIAIGLEVYSASYSELNGVKQVSSVSDNQTRLALSVPFNL